MPHHALHQPLLSSRTWCTHAFTSCAALLFVLLAGMEKATLPGPTITIHDGPGFDLNANQGPRVLSISLALIALSGIAVTLRFLSRLLSKAGLWWDDWVVLGALVHKPQLLDAWSILD